jgi:plasmid stabilization system protein ParE
MSEYGRARPSRDHEPPQVGRFHRRYGTSVRVVRNQGRLGSGGAVPSSYGIHLPIVGETSAAWPQAGFGHSRLLERRFFLVFRPFHKHVLFYEVDGENVVMRRVMHGRRDLPRRLREPPATD